MEINQSTLCDNLVEWLRTLNLGTAYNTMNEIFDGVLMAEALTQIAPDFFTSTWNSKIKPDVGSNWRLKVSNLKKIVERVIDYYQDVLNVSLIEFPKPDVVKIAEKGDLIELGRLLQLILGCAVNCEQKQEYITRIMEMEVSCQRSLMQAIQELESCIHNRNRSGLSFEMGGNVARFQSDLEARDALAQRCHELDLQVKILTEEKMTLLNEINQKLQTKMQEGAGNISESVDDCGESIGPALSGTVRYNDMRRQVDLLKDELFKAETSRDDYKAKTLIQDKELVMLRTRLEDLQVAASEAAQLKDEVDALRESADRVSNYEATIESYKKRMEEYVDLKKQVKLLEEKNVEYVQRSIEHEEETKKILLLKSQLEIYKKQVTDLHEKWDAEIAKADKLEIENKKISTKLLSLQREKDNLLQERDTLKETCEELKCSNLQRSGSNEDSVSRELMPGDLKERLIRLEHENKLLRQNQGAQGDQASVQALLEDYAQRLEKQRTINREANQKIMQLEACLEEAKTSGSGDINQKGQQVQMEMKLMQTLEENQRKSTQIEELLAALQSEKQKSKGLQENLNHKETELLATEERYRKCIDKAKEVIKTLDPRTTGQQSLSEMTLLNSRLSEKAAAGNVAGAGGGARTASQPSQDTMKDGEERLITSAFFKLGVACHRDAVEQRFALLSAGQSFLARQRQAAPRKPLHPFRAK